MTEKDLIDKLEREALEKLYTKKLRANLTIKPDILKKMWKKREIKCFQGDDVEYEVCKKVDESKKEDVIWGSIIEDIIEEYYLLKDVIEKLDSDSFEKLNELFKQEIFMRKYGNKKFDIKD